MEMIRITEQEEEAMPAIWKVNTDFIRDILDNILDPNPPYTTLTSTIKNLEKKGF
jgi:BlaI family penicillinase repressor